MAVIWGLDLREMQWGKFKSSYMFGNTDYHMRRTKFVVYQLAMITSIISEALGTAVLEKYVDQQNKIKSIDGHAVEFNNDYVGISSFNIFLGIYVATIFGGGFFFDLFWPERSESKSVKIAWRVCSVLASAIVLAAVIASTVILAGHAARIDGVDEARAQQLLRKAGGPPLLYRYNARAIASLVFLWLALPCTIASTIIMWMSLKYIDERGPFSSHYKPTDKAATIQSDEEMADTKLDDVTPGTTYPPARMEPRPEPWQQQQQPSTTTADTSAPLEPVQSIHEPIRPYSGT